MTDEPQKPYAIEPTQAIIDRILMKHRRSFRASSLASLFDRGLYVPAVRAYASNFTDGDYEAAHKKIARGTPDGAVVSYRESSDNTNIGDDDAGFD